MSNDIVTKNGKVAGQWDGQDVNELKQIMAKAKAELERGDRFVIEGMPHRDTMPDYLQSFTAYIVWGLDPNGMCLVGSGANRLESKESIDEFYGNDIAKDALARHGSDN